MAGNWCLIESDPGVFTELIAGVGVKDCEVQELYTIDADHLENMNSQAEIHGLVFLFNVNSSAAKRDQPIQHEISDLFFAKQMIQNACATQALINILMNRPAVDLGPVLSNYREFTLQMDPEQRGEVISNSEEIRTVHNSFSRQETFSMEMKMPDKDDKVFHFIAFVEHQGRVYELDGIKSGPVDHGPVEDSWLRVASQAIQKKINSYPQGELYFNLMAVTQSKLSAFQDELEGVEAQLLSLEGSGNEDTVKELQDKQRQLQQDISVEEAKHKAYAKENSRRKHNYIPLFMQLLRELSRKNKLKPLVEDSKEKVKELIAQKQASK